MSSRIAQKFDELRQRDERALVAYLTAGDPTPSRSVSLVLALERAGADIIELGVPFSDPIADGPVIQRAAERALKAGATVAGILEMARRIRQHSQIPLLLFTYLNPVLRYGFERLAAEAREAGIDGCLLTDLSVEEAGDYVQRMRAHDLDTVFLAAPTSTPRRLELVARYSTGFVYLVSRTGVTGEQDQVSGSVTSMVAALRNHTSKPIAVGFGVSRRQHVETLRAEAEGVVVGSAIVRLIEQYGASPDLEQRLETFVRELKQGTRAPELAAR
ncbi:MAG: tryptophan synthase subunit alpha [Bryobacterales bacterium]|jgi:tryptophan synthase alpha chain|nr:tryptophan synthase subunit alpha [Bryobacterales bacterium]